MSGLLILATLGLMSLPTLTRRWGQRLEPQEWVRLNAFSVVGGAVLLEFALILCAIPAMAESPIMGGLFGSHPRHFFPGGELAGWVSLVAAVLLPARAASGYLRARRHQRVTRVEAWIGEHVEVGEFELVVLPTDRMLAVAVPGKPSQIVVSRGTRNALTAPQLRAVVEHEAAHLRAGHSRYLLLASAMERAYWFFPVVRSSVRTLRLALECSADREVTSTGGDRRAIRGALLALSETGGGFGVAAFGAANELLVRLRALEPQRPIRAVGRLLIYLGFAVLVAAAVLPIGGWLAAG